jgi:hypothetical protein
MTNFRRSFRGRLLIGVAGLGLGAGVASGTVGVAWADDLQLQPGQLAEAAPEAAAGQPVTQEDLRQVIDLLEQQKKKLAAQEQALAEQQRVIAEQQNQLNYLKVQVGQPVQPSLVPVAYNLGPTGMSPDPGVGILRIQEGEGEGQQPVGEAPAAVEERPEVSIIPDQGGVLTREGQLVIEPGLEYAHSDNNRFFFQGFEIVDTILIGFIEATEADRDTITASLAARYGVTNRFEVEAKVPFLYRRDRTTTTDIDGLTNPSTQNLEGYGLGDIEVAGHYQINDGTGGWPFFVGNLKVKTVTGTSPFDVDVDSDGRAEELATGSGFWSVQPSVTTIFPTDPAVFFSNLGFTWNVADDVDATVQGAGGAVQVGRVDPGDSINTSFGMGVSLNETTSFSIGYEFNYVFPTTQESGGQTFESDPLNVGSLLFGWSYQYSEDMNINVSASVGTTEDAPDFRTAIRVPIRFDMN